MTTNAQSAAITRHLIHQLGGIAGAPRPCGKTSPSRPCSAGWREAGDEDREAERSPYGLVVYSARGTPRSRRAEERGAGRSSSEVLRGGCVCACVRADTVFEYWNLTPSRPVP